MAKERRNRKNNKPAEKPVELINITPWIPVIAILGFIVGFAICYITFVYYGGN